MGAPPKVEIRRYRRFTGWDYGRGASLFITIATAPRRALFGRVVAGKVELSELGKIVWEALVLMPQLNPGVSLFGFVVMPDHVHFNVHLAAGLDEPLKVLGNAIRRFKNHTTKSAKRLAEQSSANSTGAAELAKQSLAISTGANELGKQSSAISTGAAELAKQSLAISTGANELAKQSLAISTGGGANAGGGVNVDGQTVFGLLWQQGYHDRLCLARAFIDATERYIAYNPLKWELMYGAPETLRVHEPLSAPCLAADDYWKGVGNVALLSGKIVSLRVSREVKTPAQVAEIVSRMRSAVEKGFVILSGFVSPGEKAVRDMLCRLPGARFIRILPTCIPNARFKPESRYVGAFAERRYLEIAKGNDEVAFGRAACLDYNAEIVEIANASEGGLALYWRGDGVHRLGAAQPSPLAAHRLGAAQPSPLAQTGEGAA